MFIALACYALLPVAAYIVGRHRAASFGGRTNVQILVIYCVLTALALVGAAFISDQESLSAGLLLSLAATGALLVFIAAPCLMFFFLTEAEHLRRRERARTPRCIACNYDLTGNTSGRCPECGTDATDRARLIR